MLGLLLQTENDKLHRELQHTVQDYSRDGFSEDLIDHLAETYND
jgi:hypothetical protein